MRDRQATEEDSRREDAVFVRRVGLALLLPAVRLCRRFGVPAGELQEWARLAYFHELRERGLTVAEACVQLGVSAPTGARISRQLKMFLTPSGEHELPKRIVFMLWRKPLSRPRIRQALVPTSSEEVDRCIDALISEGRIEVRQGRTETLAVAKGEDRIVGSGWHARIGALGSLLSNVMETVEQRFFDGVDTSFARTVTLRVRPEDAPEIIAFYERELWPFLARLEARAKGAHRVTTKRLSVVVGDYEP